MVHASLRGAAFRSPSAGGPGDRRNLHGRRAFCDVFGRRGRPALERLQKKEEKAREGPKGLDEKEKRLKEQAESLETRCKKFTKALETPGMISYASLSAHVSKNHAVAAPERLIARA